MTTCDFLVIGGGVVGLSAARELKARRPSAKIVVLEKEDTCGRHASGRNSGVIHSGVYYTSDSLKAKLTKEGGRSLVRYCEEKKIPVRRCGKLIVARDESEHPMLDELVRRGAANGVEVGNISEEEARKIEPRACTAGRALYIPSTSSVDPSEVMKSLEADCRAIGVEIQTSTQYLARSPSPGLPSPQATARPASPAGRGDPLPPLPAGEGRGEGAGRSGAVGTTRGDVSAGFLLNCAGLYADKIALDFGFSKRYRILPFKGLYLESDEAPGSLRCHVYPVPSRSNPFLGVHATVRANGAWKIGPTAIPALWRENYSGFDRFDAGEFAEIVGRELALLFGSGFEFRRLAREEIRKHSRKRIVALAAELVAGIGAGDFTRWGTPGIRAQLVDVEAKTLVNDFVLEGDGRSLHVLNAVSPGFTCALEFAKVVAERVEAGC